MLDSVYEKFKIRTYKAVSVKTQKNILCIEFEMPALAIMDLLVKVGDVDENFLREFLVELYDVISVYIKPQLEEYYHCPVEDFFFPPHYRKDDVECGTIVVVFAKNICSAVNMSATLEDQLARDIAKNLKETSRRGVRHAKAYVLCKKRTLFLFSGCFSDIESKFIVQNQAIMRAIDDLAKMMEHVFEEAAIRMYAKQGKKVFIEIVYDVLRDQGMLLVKTVNE